MNKKRILAKMLAGSRNIRFRDITALLEALGFTLSRTNGSHHIYTHPQVTELVNVQDVKGQAKPYQVKQLIEIIERSGLTLGKDEAEDDAPPPETEDKTDD